MGVVKEMRIPLGKVRHFYAMFVNPRGANSGTTKMGMVITRSLAAVRIWHFHFPPRTIHTVVPRTPRSYNEINSSSSWTRILRCRLHIPLGRGQMGRRYLRALRVS